MGLHREGGQPQSHSDQEMTRSIAADFAAEEPTGFVFFTSGPRKVWITFIVSGTTGAVAEPAIDVVVVVCEVTGMCQDVSGRSGHVRMCHVN